MNTKDKKKWFLAVLLCLVMWAVCGCTGGKKMTIDTTLEMDSSFKGTRTMSALVPASIFRQAFKSDLEALQSMVTAKCPSTLLCSADETDQGVEITMTLAFANLKDYTNKIGQILGKTPGIYYESSDSVFKDGFMLQENFTSRDLFGWLVDALKEENSQFADMKLEDIFENGKNIVSYNGQTYETEVHIHVEEMESHAFDSLSVELTMNDDDSFKVALNFFVNQDTYYDMGDDMDEVIKGLLPDGGVYDVTNVNEQRVYTIEFSTYNEKTLISQLNSVLHTDKCEFKVTENGDEADPFKARKDIVMYLDGSYFLDFGRADTELVYKLNVSSDYAFDSCESLTGFLKNYSFDNSNKYTSIFMNVGPSDKVQVSLTYAVDIQKIRIATKVGTGDLLERELNFIFSSDQAELVGENFEERLRSRMSEDMVLDQTKSGNETTYTVRIEAENEEDLSRKTSFFLDGSVNEDAEEYTSLLRGGQMKKKLKTKTLAFEDRINLESFLGSASVNEKIEYSIEYPKGYAVSFEENGHSDMITENNILTCTTKDSIIIVKSKGEITNYSGITQLFLWWISFIAAILSFVINLRHIVGYIRHREKYLMKADLFKGKNIIFMTIGVVALVVWVFTSFRLILRIY